MQLKSLDEITTHYRHIFFSPHYDDVVFSCGGTIAAQVSTGLHPLVITIFGGIPDAKQELSQFALETQRGMNIESDAASAIAHRRSEDTQALETLKADSLWLHYLDAIYRGTPPYYQTREQLIGGNVDSKDAIIDQQLGEQLVELHKRLPSTTWYAPLGIGRHVDHQIVASIADRLSRSGAKVYYYEDFPYVLEEDALEARLKELGNALEPGLVEVSEMMPLKQQASALYASQITEQFGSRTEMDRKMQEYTHNIRPVETINLERYWTLR